MKDSDNQQPEEQHSQKLKIGALLTMGVGGILALILLPQYRTAILVFFLTALVLVVLVGGLFLYFRKSSLRDKVSNLMGGILGIFGNSPDQKDRMEAMK